MNKIICEERLSCKKIIFKNIFLGLKKYLAEKIPPKNFFCRDANDKLVTEMKEIFCEFIANRYHSVSICRAFCYLRNKTWLHQQLPYTCYCYECRLKSSFNRILVDRDNFLQYIYNDLETLRRLIFLDHDWK